MFLANSDPQILGDDFILLCYLGHIKGMLVKHPSRETERYGRKRRYSQAWDHLLERWSDRAGILLLQAIGVRMVGRAPSPYQRQRWGSNPPNQAEKGSVPKTEAQGHGQFNQIY